MKLLFFIMFMFTFISCATTKKIETIEPKIELTDSKRLDAVELQLQQYGKQNLTADQIMLIQIGVVGVGSISGVPAVPLLIVSSACNLVNVLLSKKADKKLSKYKINHKNL